MGQFRYPEASQKRNEHPQEARRTTSKMKFHRDQMKWTAHWPCPLAFLTELVMSLASAKQLTYYHRHLREIDCSLAIVGRPATWC